MSKIKVPPHYSPVIRSGDLIFTSGQLPLISRNPLVVPPTLLEQTILVLENIEKLLRTHAADRFDIIKTTAFIVDIDNWDIVNAVYSQFFGDHKPARSIVPVPSLHFGCLIEIEAIARFG